MRTTLRVQAFINGLTAECMMVNGGTTRWRASVSSHGLTVADTKGNILMIRRKGMEPSSGRTAENTRATGKMGNSTVSVYTRQLLGKQKEENGTKAKESNGLID